MPGDWVEQAKKAREQREFAKSLQLLQEALAAGEAADNVYFHMGNVYVDAGQLAEAEKAYRQALEVNPSHHKAMHNLGVVCRRQGRITEGVRYLKNATRLQMTAERSADGPEGKRRSNATVRLVLYLALLALVMWLLTRR